MSCNKEQKVLVERAAFPHLLLPDTDFYRPTGTMKKTQWQEDTSHTATYRSKSHPCFQLSNSLTKCTFTFILFVVVFFFKKTVKWDNQANYLCFCAAVLCLCILFTLPALYEANSLLCVQTKIRARCPSVSTSLRCV